MRSPLHGHCQSVGGGGGASSGQSSAGASGDCIPCKIGLLTPYFEGTPNFCAGEERAKWDALIACACREDTCAKDTHECKVDPMGDNAGEICDDGTLGGQCGVCLREHCPKELEACGGK